MDLLLAWKDIGFMLYAMLKAFLPLPSLEVLLIPLCVQEPASDLRYALEGAVGTCAGGLIGYLLARRLAERIARSLITPQQMEKGCRLMQRYGILAANVDDGVHLWKKKVDSFCVAAQLADLGVGFWTG